MRLAILLITIFTGSLICYGQNPAPAAPSPIGWEEEKGAAEMYQTARPIASGKDEGNEIVAIRQIIYFFDDVDKKTGLLFRNKKRLVEIELKGKYAPPVLNSESVYGFVGQKMFWSSDAFRVLGNRFFIRMEKGEFDTLNDGVLNFAASLMVNSVDEKSLTEKFKTGEPDQIVGAKFGRLDKRMLKQSLVIEEDQDSFNKRICEVNKKPE